MYFLSYFSSLLDVLNTAFGKDLAKLIAGILIAIFLYCARQLWRAMLWLIDYHRRLNRTLSDVARQTTGSTKREGDSGLWLAKPIGKPRFESFDPTLPNARIIVVANAKGGVGKTTVAANLAACVSESSDRPVLLIDLDFQASASSMAVAGEDNSWLPPPGQDSAATHLLSGDLSPQQIAGVQMRATVIVGGEIAQKDNLRLITSYNDLAQAENRVMIEWLLSDRKMDIRLRLAELLHSNEVRRRYSLIVLDCPPRLTTGTIQALAAGTHLLIPTILDRPSCEATVNFVRQVEIFRRTGVTAIKHLGIVPTMVDPVQNYTPQISWLSQRLADRWNDGGADGVASILPQPTYIHRSAEYRRAAGRGIAYFSIGDSVSATLLKERFRKLAQVVR